MDEKPGEIAHKVLLQLQDAARNVHLYVKKEKLAGVGYLASGQPIEDPSVLAQAEAQESDKDRFLNDPIIRTLFPQGR